MCDSQKKLSGTTLATSIAAAAKQMLNANFAFNLFFLKVKILYEAGANVRLL